MKKFLALILLALIFTSVIFSCENKNGERYSYEWIINKTIMSPNYPNEMYPLYDVQIPKFDLKSSYSDVINAEIQNKFSDYIISGEIDINTIEHLVCVKTEIFENDDILSVVMVSQKLPASGTSGEIFTFNYDLKNKKSVNVNSELEKAGKEFSEKTALSIIESANEEGTYKIVNISYDNFYYNAKGDLIIVLTYLNAPEDSESWKHIAFYNVNTKNLTYIRDDIDAEGIKFRIG